MLNILSLIILLFSVALHEAAHGFAAYKMGDPTAKYEGRLTLNPIKHLDPFGSVLFPVMMLLITGGQGPVFGWAKPVPINPYNFENQKRGEVVSAFAGPLSNVLLAVLTGLIARFSANILPVFYLASVICLTNLSFVVFNLITVPPLDGSHLLINLWPGDEFEIRSFFKRYGFIVLAILIMFGLDWIGPLVFRIFYFIVGI
jgi:Zn-dependent protease